MNVSDSLLIETALIISHLETTLFAVKINWKSHDTEVKLSASLGVAKLPKTKKIILKCNDKDCGFEIEMLLRYEDYADQFVCKCGKILKKLPKKWFAKLDTDTLEYLWGIGKIGLLRLGERITSWKWDLASV